MSLGKEISERLERAAEEAQASPYEEYQEGVSPVLRRHEVTHDGKRYERIMWLMRDGRRCTTFRNLPNHTG